MTRWEGGHCPKCGRPVAQKIGEPAKPCPDCTATKVKAAERDSAVEQAVYWRERALDAEGREQALAAHYEELTRIVTRHCCVDRAGTGLIKLFAAASDHWRTKPTTSLARLRGEVRRQVAEEWELALPRLKAQWQAEALENLAQANSRELIHPQIVMDMAAELHRQAEGGEW